ncbi:MAG: M1 family metallopeptidase [Propionibacteriaceae bacterium]
MTVDPRWPPPEEIRHRPHPVTYVFAVVLPLVLLVILAAPLGIVWGLSRLDPPSPRSNGAPQSTPGAAGPDEGRPGVGDPYYPDYGSSGYDALKYTITVDWDARQQTMRSTTVISARATQPLTSFYVDLALTTDRVTVDDQPATFVKSGFQDVQITPAQPIARGAEFRVTIEYSGAPGKIKRGQTSGWWTTGKEWTSAGEPESSAWWFPANDHPSDPALMDVSVRVPAGMEAISVGRLASVDTGTEPGFDTWHWISDQPMATYLNFVSIGQYQLQQGTVDGRPYVYAVSEQLSRDEREAAFAALQTSGAVVKTLESMFGPYPFRELGGVVPAHDLWFDGLETQTRPIYKADSITSSQFSSTLIAHELAHMWFGDNVTLREWNDIFTNEAYASWAQWGYTERTGGGSANDALNGLYERAKDQAGFWRITMIDPSKEHLFDAVYSRGPMVLQALRNVIGDQAFFELARDWGQDAGTRSLEEWMVKAQSKTTVDLTPFFQAWIYSPTRPERTAANGFR